ncbi:transmembrane protein 66 [Aspergillus alliaceus]|uniref:Store-operated calcium entry-associated regulatory factor n=1 Tax=Petromyces alliaceus TaxID=209559 RepID=A0A8H6AEA3_PETAA|nr:transmembrane protein 66 [Aspergillus burnettii]
MYPIIWRTLLSFLLPLSVLSYGRNSENPPGSKAILLSKVQTLTLRANRFTTARRVDPIPQLKCTGPSKRICDMYPIDTIRCTNAGYDYDEEDVQWTCTASLPQEFKLGSTDVVCEGYRNADDRWILKGSCGVEYRLLLTELGERKFGRVREEPWSRTNGSKQRDSFTFIGDILFFVLMIVVLVVMLGAMFRQCFSLAGNRGGRTAGRRFGWGGGGGGGDNGGGGPYPGPPPPYSSCPGSSSFASAPTGQGWRPGFWTGALGGAAAGYEYGRRSSRRESPFAGLRTASYNRWNDAYDDLGEGSSRSRSPQFSALTTSTGFGSTRRR